MFGAVVNFHDGAQVSKIALNGDPSSVRIDYLPPNSNHIAICSLIGSLGFDISPSTVKFFHPEGTTTDSCIIKTDDACFGEQFCARFAHRAKSSPELYNIRAKPVPNVISVGSVSRLISCRKVRISWHKLTRTAWLNFGNRKIAQRVSDKFNSGKYRILDQFITADTPESSSPIDDFTPSQDRVAWTVLLRDVPLGATENDINRSTNQEWDKPRHVELAKIRREAVPEIIPTYVESLLSRVGPVQLRIDLQSQSKRCKAMATFEEEAHAREAVAALHDKRQDFLNNGKLTVQLVYSARFRVSTPTYDAVDEPITSLAAAWRQRHIQFKVYRNSDSLKPFTTLKLQGDQARDLAEAANRLEDLLTGDVLTDGDSKLWDDALATNGHAYQLLKRIEQQNGVKIERKRARECLVFIGPRSKYQRVQTAVKDLIDAEKTSSRAIELNRISSPGLAMEAFI